MTTECTKKQPRSSWGAKCECKSCTVLRAEHHAKAGPRERARHGVEPRPKLSDCPNVALGHTYSLNCSCEPCALLRKQQRTEAAIIGGLISPLSDWMVEERYLRLEKLGKTSQEIAWDLGVSPRTVERWRKKRGLCKPRPDGSGLRAAIKAALEADPSTPMSEVAKATGLSRTSATTTHRAMVAAGEIPARTVPVRRPRGVRPIIVRTR